MTYKPRILNTELPFHITARANNKEAFPVPLDELWDLFSNYFFYLHHAFGLRIHSLVLMPNHFHLIVRDPEGRLSEAMNYFMRETSKLMASRSRTINRIWGAPFHSSLISSPLYYLHAYKYVYRNPVKAGLAADPLSYKYSTLPALLGAQRTIIPLECDDTLFENFESALQWLCAAPSEQHVDEVRRALRRKEFELPDCQFTKKPSALEEESSVPEFLKGRAYDKRKALPPAEGMDVPFLF
jgi:putative transposase